MKATSIDDTNIDDDGIDEVNPNIIDEVNPPCKNPIELVG